MQTSRESHDNLLSSHEEELNLAGACVPSYFNVSWLLYLLRLALTP